jgi:hypothetical protein
LPNIWSKLSDWRTSSPLILLAKVAGYQQHAKFIAWFDAGTQRAWIDVVFLPEGRGVTNVHVI